MPAKDNHPASPRRRPPGLRDLAAKLGVSHTAVARAMRNDPRLSQSLRDRVQSMAQEAGYFPSDVTQTLLTGWSGMIGVVTPWLTSTFVASIVNSIVAALWEDGTVPLVLCSQLDVAREEQMLKALARKRAAGVIIMPTREDRGEAQFVDLLKRHTPIVTLDSPLPRLQAPLVGSDDETGAALATRHLTSLGHRHIVFVGAAIDSEFADRRRENSYRQVMQEAGLAPEVLHLPQRHVRLQEGADFLETYLRTKNGKRTTAIFAFNDTTAYCVYAAAQRCGRLLGADLAVVGYGNERSTRADSPHAADVLHPTLTTVNQHPDQIGAAAVSVLRRLITGKPAAPSTLIEPHLIARESSSPAAPGISRK